MKSALANLSSPRLWLHGLASAFIGGVATAFLSDQGVLMLRRVGVEIDVLTLKQLAGISLSGGITNTMMYLKASPLWKVPAPTDANRGEERVAPPS